MKLIITMILVTGICLCHGQTKVTESANVTNQELLELNFDFANEIVIKTWAKSEIYVEVLVTINDGDYDSIFTLEKDITDRSITISMDKDMWKKVEKANNNCSWNTTINYTVYMPENLELEASTIIGDFILEPFGMQAQLKTISGDIDITVPRSMGIDFKAKTISGEVYSDMDISFPEGKEGLRQVVGTDIKGRVNNGGNLLRFDTISGNIYLRRG